MNKVQQEWISLEHAYNYVLREVVLPEVAVRELLAKFRRGEIATRAEVTNAVGWNGRRIELADPLPTSTWHGQIKLLPLENAAQDRPWKSGRLEKISVSAKQLYKIWPLQSERTEAHRSKRNHRPAGTGLDKLDLPYIERMKELYQGGSVPSVTKAAQAVVFELADKEVVGANKDAMVVRLVRRYKKKT